MRTHQIWASGWWANKRREGFKVVSGHLEGSGIHIKGPTTVPAITGLHLGSDFAAHKGLCLAGHALLCCNGVGDSLWPFSETIFFINASTACLMAARSASRRWLVCLGMHHRFSFFEPVVKHDGDGIVISHAPCLHLTARSFWHRQHRLRLWPRPHRSSQTSHRISTSASSHRSSWARPIPSPPPWCFF